MTTVQLWGMAVGLFLPFVLGLLLKCSWPNWAKFAVVVVVSAIVGAVELAIAGKLETGPGNWVVLIGAIVAASQVTFFWFIERIPGLKTWLYGMFIHD